MSDKENKEINSDLDWDMMDNYYTNDDKQKSVRSLEEIIKETEGTAVGEVDINAFTGANPKLLQTIEDVKKVKEASLKSAAISDIAEQLGMDKEYVRLILMTSEGYVEDSDIAIAHLVLLG